MNLVAVRGAQIRGNGLKGLDSRILLSWIPRDNFMEVKAHIREYIHKGAHGLGSTHIREYT